MRIKIVNVLVLHSSVVIDFEEIIVIKFFKSDGT
jgi:hypothetical protein